MFGWCMSTKSRKKFWQFRQICSLQAGNLQDVRGWWRTLFTVNNASSKRHVEIYGIIDDDRRKSSVGPCFLLQLLSWKWDKQDSISPWGSHNRDFIPGTAAMAECLPWEAPSLRAGRTTNPPQQSTVCSLTQGSGWQGVAEARSSRAGHCSWHDNKEHL